MVSLIILNTNVDCTLLQQLVKDQNIKKKGHWWNLILDKTEIWAHNYIFGRNWLHGVREIVRKEKWSILNYFHRILVLLLNLSERGDLTFLPIIYTVFARLPKLMKVQSCTLLLKFPTLLRTISWIPPAHCMISAKWFWVPQTDIASN